MRKIDNKGTFTIEASIIMPIFIFILVLIIKLFISAMEKGILDGEIYEHIYTISDKENHQKNLYGEKFANIVVDNNIEAYINKDYAYVYKKDFNSCEKRLRRWKLYGKLLKD